MCGSGTLLIEAALIRQNVAPGTLRSGFAFQKWKIFQPDAWGEELQEALDAEEEELTTGEGAPDDPDSHVFAYGTDRDKKVIAKARANARRAGVDHLLRFHACDIRRLRAPVPMGTVVVNPPYGVRLQGERQGELKETMADLAFMLKNEFSGWQLWLLSGDSELTRELKMKSRIKYQIFNGPIECRWMHYSINKR
jgi:putative N6-adenine-specific DNA methylase